MIQTRVESLEAAIAFAKDERKIILCTARSKAYETCDLLDTRLDGTRVCVWPDGQVDRVGEA